LYHFLHYIIIVIGENKTEVEKMNAKRIIPCLDVHEGRVVKGIHFARIKDVGDPIVCAMEYERQGADELVFLDISATVEHRQTTVGLVRETAEKISLPLTVGGGIRTIDDFRELFAAGAAKISVSTAAVRTPDLISDAAEAFGSDKVVLAIDAKSSGTDSLTGEEKYSVYVSGGAEDTGIDLVEWALKGAELGAGQILLTSIDRDGMKTGFDLDMLNAVCAATDIPVIASGGGGDLASFSNLFLETPADAALAASIFHYGLYTVGDIKNELRTHGINVR